MNITLGACVRLSDVAKKASYNSMYPLDLEWTVTQMSMLDDRCYVTAITGPFVGYRHGAERSDYIEGWKMAHRNVT